MCFLVLEAMNGLQDRILASKYHFTLKEIRAPEEWLIPYQRQKIYQVILGHVVVLEKEGAVKY